eukprot:9225-Heterococcus_DN1.PRE.3
MGKQSVLHEHTVCQQKILRRRTTTAVATIISMQQTAVAHSCTAECCYALSSSKCAGCSASNTYDD